MKKIYILPAIAFFSLFIYIFIFHVILIFSPGKGINYATCKHFKRIVKSGFKGKVLKKFIDEENHAYKTLVLETNKGNKTLNFFDSDFSQLYDSVNIGDVLIKEKDKANVELIKKEHSTFYYLDFKCNEDLFKKTHIPFEFIYY